MTSRRWQTVWVTGASTGIGRELVLKLAARGSSVAASARSADKLAELAAASGNVRAKPVDVTAREDVRRVYGEIVREIGPIDLAILNAGVWHPMAASGLDAGKAAESMSVNYLGIVNALEPLIPAVEVVEAAHGRFALGGKSGDHQAHRGAKVGCHHFRAG